ncbi:MAG: Protein translocase subunit SecD [Rhodanobacteraceae bacterium]|jgi:preprotein translocase subunit SecD|nr:MAG: Protein translocase subunit SecD [Rhodanobacteraceae bacterium]
MIDFPRWKYWLVGIVMVLGIVYAAPNAFRPQPAVQIVANREAKVDEALQKQVAADLDKANVPYQDISIEKDRMLVRFANTEVQLRGSDTLRVALGDDYTVALNLATTVPHWLQSIGAHAMPLGLDLQGGVHFLMAVDQDAVLQKQQQRYLDDIRSILRQKQIPYDVVSLSGDGVQAVFKTAADRDKGLDAVSADNTDLNITTSRTPGGGYALHAAIKPEVLDKLAQTTITQNVTTLRNRVNALGVSEPLIQQQGQTRIVVELPGVQDTAEAKRVLGATATLEYHADDPNVNPQEAAQTGNVPPDDRLYFTKDGQPVVLKKRVIVSGDELVDASQGYDQQTGLPDVNVTLNSTGARKMLDFTTQNVGKRMGVVYIERTPVVKVVDGKEVHTSKTTETVLNNAVIQGVFGKKFQTTGLTQQEAQTLSLMLRSGSLAAPMDIVQQSVIGPSLGQDNIKKGEQAVILGLCLVLIAAAIYYRLFGLVADIALVFNLLILVAIMSAIGVTLTMPGIAGIVLTLGMSIDANVLICERIREELRNGSTPLASIRAGYEKAWHVILDANVTHLLAALGLITVGSGAIKGFGVTLFIGISTSLFTSVTMTHAITALIHGRRKKLKTLWV